MPYVAAIAWIIAMFSTSYGPLENLFESASDIRLSDRQKRLKYVPHEVPGGDRFLDFVQLCQRRLPRDAKAFWLAQAEYNSSLAAYLLIPRPLYTDARKLHLADYLLYFNPERRTLEVMDQLQERVGRILPVRSGQLIGQTVKATRLNRLCEITLVRKEASREMPVNMRLRIWDSTARRRLLGESRLEAPSGIYLTFRLEPPVVLNPESTFYFELERSADAADARLLSSRADVYSFGAAFVDLSPQDYDLVFLTRALVGEEDISALGFEKLYSYEAGASIYSRNLNR